MSTSPAQKNALIVTGGWSGHTPQESAALFKQLLEAAGYHVEVREGTDTYADTELLAKQQLIVPMHTMTEISDDAWKGLNHAVQSGCGFAGFHGAMIDAFRSNTDYQWMTGGQWVAHPGNDQMHYTVYLEDDEHPITRGLGDFEMIGTEQYYCHVDPGNTVLCSTVFDQAAGDPSLYHQNVVMPYAWTKTWGKGRVFCAAWGHTHKDFDDPTAREIVRRGMLWATQD